jgi:hypothetical protein
MSLNRNTRWLVGLLSAFAFATSGNAQLYQPFIEAGYFNHDLQFFAPADDIDTYGGEPPVNYGWFGSYSRMYIGVSRPARSQFIASYPMTTDPVSILPTNAAAPVGFGAVVITGPADVQDTSFDLMDMTWGNRWDLGYMTEDDHGWLFSYMHIDGPNVSDIVHQQRLNRLNEDDPDTAGGGGQNQPQQLVGVEPASDRNQSGPPDRERFYNVTNSLNEAKLNSLELNKVFRMAPLTHGGILEPFLGFRYVKFEDSTVRQTYIGANVTYLTTDPPIIIDPGTDPIVGPGGVILPGRAPITFPAPPGAVGVEALLSDEFLLSNQMIGGQLGLRWYQRVSRWNLSSELRAFGMENFQHLSRSTEREYTFYDSAAQGADVTSIRTLRTTQERNATATVIGTDIRAEAAYEITRDLKLIVGMQFLGFFSGVGRGPFIGQNSETLTMVGTTFGVEARR